MKQPFLMVGLLALVLGASAQSDNEPRVDTSATGVAGTYRGSATKINDLVHTKLDVKFDFQKSYLYGKAWITLKPHFYDTDSLELDAKGMDINKVALLKGSSMETLKYQYDGNLLHINLGKTFRREDRYTVYIDYVSKPNELKVQGSAAITDAKGLYFINPKGEEKDKPTQVWTQGESEANSAWFPTIDKPNQKTTDEIYMTVPEKFVTLSNGILADQHKNSDGTRTDHWKMDLPHAPYLFFMGVGDYAIIKDSYKGKEVAYYVEKPYAAVARKIFGLTPEMIAFYSRITGVDYAWPKYDQIVGRDYVSGAMENTTATLHQESAQQDSRELVDGNSWEEVIAHELFHQWFGDLVTTESWSNLTLNESFANYSETLWSEYKHGKDAGDAQNYSDMQGYLGSHSESKDLVRFYYNDKEDMFDAVSYNKGGRILHMLRHYLGDSAFFKGLNLYLTTNKFKSAEAHQLRLAMEEVSGQDLNWFFNQWYFGSGHPVVDISYGYDDAAGKVTVTIKQNQSGGKIFRLPLAIDIYTGKDRKRYNVWVENKVENFVFNYSSHPDLVNVDGDKITLWEKKDHKTLENYLSQYKWAGNYVDRREAIEFCATKQDDPQALALLKQALKDPYFGLRNFALNTVGKVLPRNASFKTEVEPQLVEIAGHDPKPTVRAAAIGLLGQYKKAEYRELFTKAINDSSYSIAGEGLEALSKLDPEAAVAQAKKFSRLPGKGKLMSAVNRLIIEGGSEEDFEVIASNFAKLPPLSDAKFEALQPFANYLSKLNNTEKVKKGVDLIVDLREAIPAAYKAQANAYINNMILKSIVTKKTAGAGADAAQQEQINYINSKIGDKKPG